MPVDLEEFAATGVLGHFSCDSSRGAIETLPGAVDCLVRAANSQQQAVRNRIGMFQSVARLEALRRLIYWHLVTNGEN